jgi:predicted HNH restriction endonuclease
VELTTEQYKEALVAEGVVRGRSVELLNTLYNAPNCEATASELASSLGYRDFPPVNALLGKLAKRIAHYHGINKEALADQHAGTWGGPLIADGREDDRGYIWWLKGNLFDALVELGLLEELESLEFPEVIPNKPSYIEGCKKVVTVNRYERSISAKNACKAYFGTRCQVCEVDFAEEYGEIGVGFIHVHHLVEIAEIGESYEVNPIEDLVPVCPNCHAMLHQRKPAYSVDKLKEIMQSARHKAA